ncbi:MAG TPA: short-chain dehydrogenase, partial [Candidatus Binatia bacterium]
IDTPYVQHAKNLMPVEPMNPPPVYAPDIVAEAILHCAEHQERDVFVGGGGKMLVEAGQHAPRLTDKVIGATLFDLQKSDRPKARNRRDSLYAPSKDGEERGVYPGHVAESSAYTKASLHPLLAGTLIAGLGLAAYAGWRSLSANTGGNDNA